MSDISLIEWIVYGFLSYTSILVLIISTIKDVPIGKSLSLIRVIYLIPGMISSGILASSGIHVTMPSTSSTIINLTKLANGTLSTNSTSTTTITEQFTLLSPVWQMVHIMIFLVLLVYIIQQITIFMTAKE